MNRQTRALSKSALLLSTLMGGMLITSCSSAPSPASMDSAPVPPSMEAAAPSTEQQANGIAADVARGAASNSSSPTEPTTGVPQAQPKLVKTAQITLTVDSVKQSIGKVTAIARQQQGDILGLQDQIPPNRSTRHTASLQLRVPQAKLDATINNLTALGTVQQQAITAEDVSTQLVDFQARLRNLRNTETMLLKIMERSGSIGDVLKVSQEVSNVRSQIEQLDAQLTNLSNRVAYSVVSVTLEEAIASIPPQTPLATEMQESWEQASHAVGQFTVGLMKLGIWLVAYSPYWLILAIAATVWSQRRRASSALPVNDGTEPPTAS